MNIQTGINIASFSKDGLGAVLTNPTELAFRKGTLKKHYPITDKTGKVWVDAEAAYKHFKTGNIERDKVIMTKIIAAKLRQYPQIVKAVEARGGVDWLKSCRHIITKRSRWEGVGMDSNFIACLVMAYESVKG